MGHSPARSGVVKSRMIKSVFLAVVAAASAAPEADPQLLLAGHAALPYAAAPVVAAPAAYSFAPVGAVHSSSVVKSVEVAPAEVSHEVTAHAVPVAVGYHGYGFGHYYGKRDADPAVLAGHTKVLTAPTPLIHNPPVLPVVHHAPVAPVAAYAGLGYHGLGYGLPLAHAVVKRDAEADPAVVLGALPYAHAPVVAPAVHAFASVGAVTHAPVVKAVVEAPAEVSHEVTAHPVPVAVGYHGYGGYPFYG